MSDPTPDEPPTEAPPVEPATVPTYAGILALLGLPADARSVVITPESAVAIAADYPEPYTPPTEES